MISLITIAIILLVVCGALFGAFLAISFAIRREDGVGSLTGQAPSRACRSARFMTGLHCIRWESAGPSRRRMA
jgi:hypothetical protein